MADAAAASGRFRSSFSSRRRAARLSLSLARSAAATRMGRSRARRRHDRNSLGAGGLRTSRFEGGRPDEEPLVAANSLRLLPT
jgi:hypothetical protein